MCTVCRINCQCREMIHWHLAISSIPWLLHYSILLETLNSYLQRYRWSVLVRKQRIVLMFSVVLLWTVKPGSVLVLEIVRSRNLKSAAFIQRNVFFKPFIISRESLKLQIIVNSKDFWKPLMKIFLFLLII